MGAITDVTWPAQSPVSVLKTIPAYPYVQYQDDDNITAFFDALNIYSQAYLDWFNALDLPIYTQAPVAGPLLDWVGQSIYNTARPGLPTSEGSPEIGPVNTFYTNEIAVNGYVPAVPDTYISVNDDFYRRILTWKLYCGDGDFASIPWLKRRINRFLNGVNGTDVTDNTTYEVSITSTGVRQWTITLPSGTASLIFQNAVIGNIIELPFQASWTVVVT